MDQKFLKYLTIVQLSRGTKMFNYFSYVLMGTIGIYVLLKRNLKNFYRFLIILTISCTLCVNMGFFIKIGNHEITYNTILVYFTAFIGLIIMLQSRIKVNITFFKSIIYFLIIIFLNYISFLLFRYKEEVIVGNWDQYVKGIINFQKLSNNSLKIGYYLMFICICIILLVCKSLLNFNDYKLIAKGIITISKFNIILGYVEYAIVNIFNSKIITDLCIDIFGTSGSQQNYLYYRGIVYVSQGATKEPAMYVTSMFYIAILFIIEIKFLKGQKISTRTTWRWLISCIVLIAINVTMSSVVYLIILILIMINCGIISKSKKESSNYNYKCLIILTISILFIILAYVFLTKYYAVLLGSNNYIIKRVGIAVQQILVVLGTTNGSIIASSESSRFMGIYYNLGMLLKRPLLGFGVGTLNCVSGVVIMLVNIGVLGFTAWCNLIIRFSNNSKYLFKEFVFFVLIAIFPNLLLNDYNTILCLVIPLSCILYSYSLKREERSEAITINKHYYLNL